MTPVCPFRELGDPESELPDADEGKEDTLDRRVLRPCEACPRSSGGRRLIHVPSRPFNDDGMIDLSRERTGVISDERPGSTATRGNDRL
jgi:hypothetical protein